MKGLRWENASGDTNLKEGDQVTFRTSLVCNKDIPAGVKIGVKVTVDGKESYVTDDNKNGLKANQPIMFQQTLHGQHSLVGILLLQRSTIAIV